MTDANKIAESVLELMGISPLVERLMDEASETIDGEYGSVDDEDSFGVCYSHISLIDNGVLSTLLKKNLTSSKVVVFKKIAGESLDLGIERSSWGNITLSLQLEIPSTPNAKRVDKVFSLDIAIRKSGAKHIVSGTISDDDARDIEKSLMLYSLVG